MVVLCLLLCKKIRELLRMYTLMGIYEGLERQSMGRRIAAMKDANKDYMYLSFAASSKI